MSGFDPTKTTDENTDHVIAVQRLTWAYLRSALYPEDTAWDAARAAFMDAPDSPGRLESK